ncbi:hypothetical protein [Streptomyces sp. TRM68367]|uniref:hypothetical protein n=1 Tax=Streptomyces sp. TRM68367 TaxID=2758415 RepID=UPI00165C2D4B|nr:hypothetical protein [Streptomyces sp. TRM68367]MBC9725458.1 hypothetical protein [Streptomyces sp. TRM68367]
MDIEDSGIDTTSLTRDTPASPLSPAADFLQATATATAVATAGPVVDATAAVAASRTATLSFTAATGRFRHPRPLR